MYIKVIKHPKNDAHTKVGAIETVREVKLFTHEIQPNGFTGELELILTFDNEVFTFDENTSISVYVMSDTGKTIDKVEWDYFILHPEILA